MGHNREYSRQEGTSGHRGDIGGNIGTITKDIEGHRGHERGYRDMGT